jgi:hypothetical protein
MSRDAHRLYGFFDSTISWQLGVVLDTVNAGVEA